MKKYLLLLLLIPAIAYGATYTSKKGDTLKKIADKQGITVSQLAELNPNLPIPTGTKINVPDTPTPPPTTGEKRFQAYITAYTYWDNTPPGSADIALPVIHSKAGGTGTYQDPITMAVGHVISGGKSTPDYPKGTIFYIPNHRRYFIVEDLCGDGNTPQNGPCHIGYQGKPWLDIWIDGKNGSRSSTNTCAENLTDIHTVIQNPGKDYPVVSGAIYGSSCSQQYGDSI